MVPPSAVQKATFSKARPRSFTYRERADRERAYRDGGQRGVVPVMVSLRANTERGRERGRQTERERVCVCVCVCVQGKTACVLKANQRMCSRHV